jgi:hypothetical protein
MNALPETDGTPSIENAFRGKFRLQLLKVYLAKMEISVIKRSSCIQSGRPQFQNGSFRPLSCRLMFARENFQQGLFAERLRWLAQPAANGENQ